MDVHAEISLCTMSLGMFPWSSGAVRKFYILESVATLLPNTGHWTVAFYQLAFDTTWYILFKQLSLPEQGCPLPVGTSRTGRNGLLPGYAAGTEEQSVLCCCVLQCRLCAEHVSPLAPSKFGQHVSPAAPFQLVCTGPSCWCWPICGMPTLERSSCLPHYWLQEKSKNIPVYPGWVIDSSHGNYNINNRVYLF